MKWVTRTLLLVAVAASVTVTRVTEAHASYNGGAAAQYADTYWNNYNIGHYPSYSDDCTNFASQAIHAGGMPFVGGGPYTSTDDSKWYMYPDYTGAYYRSYSWTVAPDLYAYLDYFSSNPEGYDYGNYKVTGNWASSGLNNGDLVFYDWTSDGSIDHVGIRTAHGYDNYKSSFYGDLVDYHTSNRYHIIWTTASENSNYNQETVHLIHIQ